ncbi:MAG: tetratricopeptide repeat protein [Candidatus Omnitrophica bacterium]|nr:tetratricopeptide repeat protein [Candidatus Omnitrophota bacterium]
MKNAKSRSRIPRALFLALGLALFLRSVSLFFSRQSPFYEPVLLDPGYYHEWAQRLARGDFGSGVFQGLPLYPFFLAACYRVFGGSIFAVKIIQILLGLLAVCLVYLIGKKLDGPKTGVVAAFFAALYGPLFFYEGLWIAEVPGLALYAAAFYFVCETTEAPSAKRAVLAGIFLALAVLTKAGILLFAVLWACFLLGKGLLGADKACLRAAAAFLAAFFLTLAPAPLHNFIRGKDAVFLTAHGGLNFYIGNNPRADGFFVRPEGVGGNVEAQIEDSKALAERALGRSLRPSEVSRWWAARARDFIVGDPLRFLRLVAKKTLLFFSAGEFSDIEDYRFEKRFNAFLRLPWPDFGWLGPLFFVGVFAAPGRLKFSKTLFAWTASYVAAVALFFVSARYRLPLLGVFFPVASFGAIQWWESLRRASWGRAAFLGGAFLLGVGLVRLPLVPPESVRDLVNAGDVYLKKGDPARALPFYREAIGQDPRNAKAHLAAGVALTLAGKGAEAGEDYRKSVALEPSADAYNNLGLWHESRGEIGEAERCFKKAIELKPHSSQAHNNLGMVYAKKGDFESATEELETSLKINPAGRRAQANLDLLLRRRRSG